MSRLWVICGAGRGVGKTHLSSRLTEVLPRAAYAKCGQSRRKPGKQPNYFTSESELEEFVRSEGSAHDHLVVEFNGWALEGRGDLIIYVGPIPGQTNIRGDVGQLRSRAHVSLASSGSIGNWRRALVKRMKLDASTCNAVLDVLVEHKRYLNHAGPSVHTKMWFAVGDLHVFGSGLARLLRLADRHGTLSAAADEAGMSYRHAWDLVKTAEKHLDRQLLELRPGGAQGGQAELTPDGRHLLDVYTRLRREVSEFADERFAHYYGSMAKAIEPAVGD